MLLKHPSLLGLSLIPVIATATLLLLFAFGLAWAIGATFGKALGDDFRIAASALIFTLALMLGYFFYLPIARVILAPFSEALSRKTHSLKSGGEKFQSPLGWRHAMIEGLKMAILHIVIGTIALAIGIGFPPAGLPIGVATAIFLCGLDFFDVPLSARGLSLRKKLSLIFDNKSLAIGFGVAAYLSLLIPVVNLLLLPAGVVGATLLTTHLNVKKN